MYSLGAKKTYLEFAQTRVKPVIHFYGFNRNVMMQDIRYDKKDKLTQLFAEVQYDLEELYIVQESKKATASNANIKDENKIFQKQNTNTFKLSSFLIQDLPEKSFGMQLNKNGVTNLCVIDEDKFVTIIHHVGDFESLLSYAYYKKEKKTPPNNKNERRKFSDISRQYLYLKPKTMNDSPETRLISNDSKDRVDDVKFIQDYQFLMKFCFEWLEKPLPEDVKIENDLFTVVSNDPIKIQFNNSPYKLPLHKVITKYFEFINNAVVGFTGDKDRGAIVAYPKGYTVVQKTRLRKCIENAKIKILREVDAMTQLLNKIQQIVNNNTVEAGVDKVLPRFRRILDSEIKDDKACGFEIDSTGHMTITLFENNELKRLRNHVGEIKTISSKLHADLVTEFKQFIGFAFKYLAINEAKIEGNDHVEIISNNPIVIRIKQTLDEYTLDHIILRYLQFVANILVNYTDGRINKIILAYPMDYTADQKSELIKCIGSVGYQFIKDVDVIEQYFNKIQNLLKPTYIPEEESTNRNRIILDESYNHETFSFQQNSKGRCRITVLKDNAYLIVANHLGDVESAKVKINGSLELIRNFRQFIEVSCKLASQLEIDKNEVFPGFEVLYTDQVKVKLKNTSIEYTLTDVLNFYYSYLINSTVEMEPGTFKNIIFAYPYEFKKCYIDDARKSIEKTGLKLVKEVDGLEQVFNRFENLTKSQKPSFTNQETCSILHTELLGDSLWGMEMCIKGSTAIGRLINGKFSILNHYIGNLNQIVKNSKIAAETEFLKDLKSIVNYSLATMINTNNSEAVKSFKAFEASQTDALKLKYKTSVVEYNIFDILIYYYKSILKSLSKLDEKEPITNRNVIVSLPLQFSCNSTDELKKLMETAGFMVVKFINQVDQQFNRVINQLKTPNTIETMNIPEEYRYPSIRSIFDEDLRKHESFSIEFYPGLRLAIGFIQDGIHMTVMNHIGDLHSYPLNSAETENEAAISRFKGFIEYCFKVFSEIPRGKNVKSNNMNKNIIEKSKTKKLAVNFINSSIEFPVIEILTKYFKLIIEAFHSCNENKLKNVILAGRTEYNQINATRLKTLMEACGLVFKKFENPLDQQFYRVLNEIELPYKCETKNLIKNQEYPIMRSIYDKTLQEKDSFSIEYFDNARLAIGLIENNTHYTIMNHLGDLGNYAPTKNDRYHHSAITALKDLIELCLLALIDANAFDKTKEYESFKVSNTEPIKISFPFSSELFKLEDVFVRLIKYIQFSVKKCSGNQGNKIYTAIPIGKGYLDLIILTESVKSQSMELKKNFNELERLFNRTKNQIDDIIENVQNDTSKTTITSILHTDLNSEGIFGLIVDSDHQFSLCGFKDGKYQTIENHSGNINNLIQKNKFMDSNSMDILNCLLKYSYRTFFNFETENIVKNNEVFEIVENDPTKIRFKKSSEIFSIEDCVKIYLQIIKDEITKFLGTEAKEVIAVVPSEYDKNRKLKLKEQLESSGIKLIRYENDLDTTFNRIMNLEQIEVKEEVNTLENLDIFVCSSKYFDEMKYDEKNTFVVEMKENGDIAIGILNNQDYLNIIYNAGLPRSALKNKYSKNNQDEELIQGFKDLLEFCFSTLGKSVNEIEKIESEFFLITSTSPEIRFRLKDSLEEYSVEQFIGFYFEWISKLIFVRTKLKTKSMVLICPPQFGIFQRGDLKKCIEKTSLIVRRILTIPVSESLAISLIDKKQTSMSFHTNKYVLIDWNSGTINVTLSEQNEKGPLKVLMSFQGSELKNLQKLLDELKTNDADELNRITEEYINESVDLFRAILSDMHITQSNLKRIDFCFKSELTIKIGELFKKHLSELDIYSNVTDAKNFYFQNDLDYIEEITRYVNFMTNENETLVKTSLCFNFGIQTFLGKFDVLLKRGTELPFRIVKGYCTVGDFQTRTMLKVYRGERPFVKYCEKLGLLSIENLPERKAGEVSIKVGFSVAEDETLKIEAKYIYKDDYGKNVESDLYETNIDRATAAKISGNEGSMILEAQKYKEDDLRLINKANETSALIDYIRKNSKDKYNQLELLDSLNDCLQDITKCEENLNDELFDAFIERLKGIKAQIFLNNEVPPHQNGYTK